LHSFGKGANRTILDTAVSPSQREIAVVLPPRGPRARTVCSGTLGILGPPEQVLRLQLRKGLNRDDSVFGGQSDTP